ncbi:uncharacterized protein BX664DRAFT_327710 [Halteromyces radiatus]|uniref:uncharacterized protein n=1 Tax=Halteromyces radiatus TaxID=101107 RepID=UPI002220CE2F|nr:uncharacterized protein BX664DRAFT_327710 [Halteromyces radiatus]KAI8092614.1 hypothetical protein BX664DRAFT_327710 [Halteromyces radiatus]
MNQSSARLHLPMPSIPNGVSSGGYFPQQLGNPMMNPAMQQQMTPMNMPLPNPSMIGMQMGHSGIPRPPPAHWNNGPWDPMMMDSMMGPPPPFGFPGGSIAMNPMGGPLGPMGMLPPMHHDEMNNHKKPKDDKKPKEKGDESKEKTINKGEKESSTVSAAAAAAAATTTTPAEMAAAEQQLPPLATTATEAAEENALVRSTMENNKDIRRKPSIWNLFGMGGNRAQMMAMQPYAPRPVLPFLPPPDFIADAHRGEHPKLTEMIEKFQQLMYVWCYVMPMEDYRNTAWCTFKIQNQRKLNYADRHNQRTVTLDKEKNLPGTVIVNPRAKTAVMYKSLWSTTKMIITIMCLPQEEYRRQRHALSTELIRRWGSKPSSSGGVFNSMFRDYAR